MLAGLEEPDSRPGRQARRLTVGYLPQDGLSHSGRTLIEEAGLAFKPLLDMRAEIAALEERLGDDARRRAGARRDARRATASCRRPSAGSRATAST